MKIFIINRFYSSNGVVNGDELAVSKGRLLDCICLANPRTYCASRVLPVLPRDIAATDWIIQ